MNSILIRIRLLLFKSGSASLLIIIMNHQKPIISDIWLYSSETKEKFAPKVNNEKFDFFFLHLEHMKFFVLCFAEPEEEGLYRGPGPDRAYTGDSSCRCESLPVLPCLTLPSMILSVPPGPLDGCLILVLTLCPSRVGRESVVSRS